MTTSKDTPLTLDLEILESLVFAAFQHQFESSIKNFKPEEFRNLFDSYKEDVTSLLLRKYDEGILLIQIGETHDSQKKHALVKDNLLYLKEKGLLHLCLEFEHTFQKTYDSYVSTGEESYLQKIIERERILAERGYPADSRIDSGYFDILREAKRIDLRVHFVDSDFDNLDPSAEMRDPEMALRIPKNEKALFYCGELHLPTTKIHIQKISSAYPVFTIGQIEKGDKVQKIISNALEEKRYVKPYALDLNLHEDIREIFKKGLVNEYRHFDAIVCHTSEKQMH